MNCEVKRLTLPDAALAVKIRGRSHHQPPSRAARRYPRRGGTREAQTRFALSHQTREIHVFPRLMRRLVKVSTHSGEGSAL